MNTVDKIMDGLNIERISEDMFRINKYNFYMKSANKFTEFLQIKIYLGVIGTGTLVHRILTLIRFG